MCSLCGGKLAGGSASLETTTIQQIGTQQFNGGEGKGQGLGWHSRRRVVARHLGMIDERSQVGAGTAVRVTLPIQPPDAGTAGPGAVWRRRGCDEPGIAVALQMSKISAGITEKRIIREPGMPATVARATLLIVDDQPENLAVLGGLLQHHYAVLVASSGAGALAVATRQPTPDLILLDLMMPEMDGYAVLNALRENPVTRDIPVLLLAERWDAGDEEYALSLGAVDYLVKPVRSAVVLARVRNQLDVRRARAILRDHPLSRHGRTVGSPDLQAHGSLFDDLTGLPNRNLLKDRLAHAIAQPRHPDAVLAVLTIEPDRFQSVNETLGREAGDCVITELAARLAAHVHPADTLARVEGDEFVLVADIARVELASVLAQAIIAAMARPLVVAGRELTLGASIGIALFPKDGERGDDLLRCAVSAMHKARAEGGGRSHLYATDMDSRALERLEMEGELRRAIGNGELLLHYQPQLRLRTGRIVGAEALVRWQHPTRGLVPPATFIPLAEDTGLIMPLGAWVLRQACLQNKAWQDAGLARIRVAVNLSARQFESQDMLALVAAALKESGLDPACLELELTESAVMKDAEAFIRTTRQFKARSVSLSIDDFGTGFSSLSYLRRFEFNHLKIDQSFIQDINRDPDNAMIALAVISLAHNLRMSVIAEGVESVAQLAFLRARGCDEMQGDLFSRPLPAAEFAALLGSGRALELPADPALPARTLLLVDDEAGILASLQRLFRREGYTVLAASNGAEALDLLAMHVVQVIISDAHLPVMDGSELLAKVRALYPDTVRMMLSGYTDLQAVTRAVNSGELYQFITKPWDDVKLVEAVRAGFRYHESRRAATHGVIQQFVPDGIQAVP
ncbi:MAG: Bacteriophytochrome cph2 [Candidatus Accumulibacter cognatus]|uniref:Bacteriophytochrome cph2 n=3 Tax=Candidatus Accumulibacter TaxID=327159 RepID=A0A080MCN7_9PROT|nr:MAG: Bacteriophytochrome cph2 [Candidatus Accumulibacter cognatus]